MIKRNKLPIHGKAWMNLKSIDLNAKKPHLEDYKLFNSIYVKLEKKTYYSTKKRINGVRVDIGDWLQRDKKYIFGVTKMFYILILWYWHNLYIFAKAHELNILKSESFIVCRLCLEINRLKKKERNCAPDEENPSSITMGFRTTQPLSKLGRLLPKQEAASTQPAMSTSSAMVHTTKLYAYHLFLCSLTHFQITVEKPISQQES